MSAEITGAQREAVKAFVGFLKQNGMEVRPTPKNVLQYIVWGMRRPRGRLGQGFEKRERFAQECLKLAETSPNQTVRALASIAAGCVASNDRWWPLDQTKRWARAVDKDLVLGWKLLSAEIKDFFVAWGKNGIRLYLGDERLLPWPGTGSQRQAIPADIRRDVLSIGLCALCGATEFLSIDHIKPVLLGGTNDRENLQCLCRSCNSRKGATYDA